MAHSTSQDLYSFLKEKGLTPQPSSSSPPPTPTPSSNEGTSGPEPMLSFDTENIGERLRQASEKQLDNADFGIVRVDDEGRVQFYNRYESELANVPKEEARGKNFFTQLAPCSNNRIFLGRFKKGVRTGDMDERFTYTFTYKMRPTLVDVRLYRDDAGNNWVMVRKR